PERNARLLCRCRARTAFWHGIGRLSGMRYDASRVYLRCAGKAAARPERRHYLRREFAGPARARAPLFFRLLARQVRKLPSAPGHEAGQPAQAADRPGAGFSALAAAGADSL